MKMLKCICSFIVCIALIGGIVASFWYDFLVNKNCITMLTAMWSISATVVLGSVAYWQNKRYKEMSDKYSQKIDRLMLTPECHLVSIPDRLEDSIPYMIANTENDHLEYNLKFCSLNLPLIDITVQEIEFSTIENSSECLYFPHSKIAFSIPKFSVFETCSPFFICITVPKKYSSQKISCNLTLSYKNIYGATLEKRLVLIKDKNNRMKKSKANQAKIIGEI